MAISAAHYQQLSLEGPRHVVVADGDLDAGTSVELAAALDEPIEAGKTHVVLDLTSVGFMDSMASHVLMGAPRELRQRFGKLVLVSADPHARWPTELTSFDVLAPVCGSREAAPRG